MRSLRSSPRCKLTSTTRQKERRGRCRASLFASTFRLSYISPCFFASRFVLLEATPPPSPSASAPPSLGPPTFLTSCLKHGVNIAYYLSLFSLPRIIPKIQPLWRRPRGSCTQPPSAAPRRGKSTERARRPPEAENRAHIPRAIASREAMLWQGCRFVAKRA